MSEKRKYGPQLTPFQVGETTEFGRLLTDLQIRLQLRGGIGDVDGPMLSKVRHGKEPPILSVEFYRDLANNPQVTPDDIKLLLTTAFSDLLKRKGFTDEDFKEILEKDSSQTDFVNTKSEGVSTSGRSTRRRNIGAGGVYVNYQVLSDLQTLTTEEFRADSSFIGRELQNTLTYLERRRSGRKG